MKRPPVHRRPFTWLPLFGFYLLFASTTMSGVDVNDLIVPLNEETLTHMESTLDYYAAQVGIDPGLKTDFKSFQKDKQISGDTEQALSDSIAKRHPKFAAFAAAEKWTPGGLYLTYIMCVGIPVSEALGATNKDADNARVRKNMQFYEKHKARMDALAARCGKLFG